MDNEFIKIISSPMLQTSNVIRYSGTKMVEPENLTTHIYETQIIGYMIINYLNNHYDENLDRGLYLEKALHHDMEEAITGDVVRTLKYHNERILHELQEVAYEVAEELYKKYFDDENGELLKIWDTAKCGKEGVILKLVDTLTVVNRVIKEVEFLGNVQFIRVAHEVRFYLKELVKMMDKVAYEFYWNPQSIEYLKMILEGAFDSLTKILEDNKEVIERYGIVEKSLIKENV